MAFSSPKKNGNRRVVISEINITPFVDVLLVLLIIFMVAAPMLTSSVDVNLPQGAKTANEEKLQTFTISIKADSTIYFQDDLVKLSILGNRLKEISGNNFTRKIFVRADKNLDYGRVMEVVKTVSQVGFSQVVLVTEIPK
ncbi:MAG: biopolymer transporter ExbD [Alphaproteobacteria bacterium]|nr:biopolymer transporter ExbD [Alphaproteobacteria bacterium]